MYTKEELKELDNIIKKIIEETEKGNTTIEAIVNLFERGELSELTAVDEIVVLEKYIKMYFNNETYL